MTMLRTIGRLSAAVLLLCLASVLVAGPFSEIDDQLLAKGRVFSNIGPGLRTVRRGADGKYYVLTSPAVGVAVFDSAGKPLAVIGARPAEAVANKSGQPAIGFGEDCDVDAKGVVYIADRGSNLIDLFSPDGKPVRSIAANAPTSLVALPEGEVAVTSAMETHLVTVYGPAGTVVREFGSPESLSERQDVNRYLSIGRLASDAQGRIYYGYTYMPEPLVRQYDRFGYAGLDFQFTGLDAYPEAQVTRKAIVDLEKEEKRKGPISLRQILTAFGVDPVNGDVWMALHNTLIHFDKEANRRSEYQIYTPKGARLEANTILVEEERLLIGADPLGVYEFPRPDRKH
jgi:hypothetical protein